jgi:hypothetical protein
MKMLNLRKNLKLAGVLAIALGAAAPMMTSAASAAPAGHYDVQRTAQNEHGQRDARFGHQQFEHGKFMRHGGKHGGKDCHHGFHGQRGR